MSKAVIFDFDGIIAETEDLQFEAFNRLLTQLDKPKLSEQDFIHQCIGRPTSVIISRLKSSLQISVPSEELVAQKEIIYDELLRTAELEPRQGLPDLLSELKTCGWRLAIASSSPSTTLRRLLGVFHIDKYFDTVLSSESVNKGKPAPDIYELAAVRLSIDKSRIVVIEDSPSGLEAAKQAHLRCVIVPNRLTRDLDFEGYDLRVEQLIELTHSRLLSTIQTKIVYVPKSETGYCSALFSAICDSRRDDRVSVISGKPSKDEDVYAQIELLEEIAINPPDSLIVVAIDDRSGIRGILHRMAQKGTSIVAVDQVVNLEAEGIPDSPYRSFSVAADCLIGGELAARALLEGIAHKGTVAVISGPRDLKPCKDRRLGFLGLIASYAPDVRLQTVRYTEWHKDEGAQAAEGFIREGLDLQGIFCCCDSLAIEVANVYRGTQRAGRTDLKMPAIVGFDGIPEVYDYIVEGHILATVDVGTAHQGRIAFRAARGEIAQRITLVEPKLLTIAAIKRARHRTRCFISYSRANGDIAQQLFDKLSAAGFQVFMDSHKIAGGEKFVGRYRDEIANAQVFVALMSPEAVKSDYVQDELQLALHREARRNLSIIPIRLKGDYVVPISIQDHSFLQFSGVRVPVDDGEFRELVRAIDQQRKQAAQRD